MSSPSHVELTVHVGRLSPGLVSCTENVKLFRAPVFGHWPVGPFSGDVIKLSVRDTQRDAEQHEEGNIQRLHRMRSGATSVKPIVAHASLVSTNNSPCTQQGMLLSELQRSCTSLDAVIKLRSNFSTYLTAAVEGLNESSQFSALETILSFAASIAKIVKSEVTAEDSSAANETLFMLLNSQAFQKNLPLALPSYTTVSATKRTTILTQIKSVVEAVVQLFPQRFHVVANITLHALRKKWPFSLSLATGNFDDVCPHDDSHELARVSGLESVIKGLAVSFSLTDGLSPQGWRHAFRRQDEVEFLCSDENRLPVVSFNYKSIESYLETYYKLYYAECFFDDLQGTPKFKRPAKHYNSS